MNYEDMSDFEINEAVCIALGYEVRVGDKYNEKFKINCPHSVWFIRPHESHCEHKDYCNKPADAWPIITECGIIVWPGNAAMYLSLSGRFNDEIDYDLHTANTNPLRAAMVVFLKMQEHKK